MLFVVPVRGSRAERVQWTKQRRHGWRSAPVFASTIQVRRKNRLSARGIRLHPKKLNTGRIARRVTVPVRGIRLHLVANVKMKDDEVLLSP